MDVASYSQAYQDQMTQAPERALSQPYLGGRPGYPSSTNENTTCKEEHLAMALVNAQPGWYLPDETKFKLLDYQVPLQSAQADAGIGKIDMFGLAENGRALVVELKVISHTGGKGNPPPVALLQGLRYASIIEANLQRIANEVQMTFGRNMVLEKPDIVVLGEMEWWSYWLRARTTKELLERKASEISQAIEARIVFAGLTDTPSESIEYGQRNKPPRLVELPRLEYRHPVPNSAM